MLKISKSAENQHPDYYYIIEIS